MQSGSGWIRGRALVVTAAFLAFAILLPAVAMPAPKEIIPPAPQVVGADEYEKMTKDLKEGKPLDAAGKKFTLSETGDMLAKFEHLPGGKTAVAIGRKIIVMYREYLDKLMAFVREIDM